MVSTGDLFDIYRIVRPSIASGGSGVVHEAIDPDGRRVAIKVLDRETIMARAAGRALRPEEQESLSQAAYDRQVGRFKDEYQVLVGLRHPHVAEILRIGFFEEHFFTVSEFIEGQPLANYLLAKPPIEMVPLFVQALDGLDFIHKSGLIHLDIKSDNILVTERDGVPTAKIIDFGLAMMPASYHGAFLGSASYIAPEVAMGHASEVDARADLFSFGVLMYRCITWHDTPVARPRTQHIELLRRAIEREKIVDLPSAAHARRPGFVPEYLDTIVMRLLAKKPADRFYGNARAVANALLTHAPDLFGDSPDGRGAYLRPSLDLHIGRDEELRCAKSAIDALLRGEQPDPAILCLCGGAGVGKSHFLKTVADRARRHIERMSIHSISFPAGGDMISRWVLNLGNALADHKLPVAIFVDNLHEARPGDGISPIDGVLRLIADRVEKPELFAGVPPVFMCCTTSGVGHAPGSARAIELRPFGRAEVAAYLAATPALKGRSIPEEWIDALHRRTSGVPREVMEQLEKLDSRGLLFGPDGEVVVAAAHGVDVAGDGDLPASTRDRLLGEYRSLGAAERMAVNILACWSILPPPRRLRTEELLGFVQDPMLVHRLHLLVQKEILQHDAARDGWALADEDFLPGLISSSLDPNERMRIHGMLAARLGGLSARDRGEEDALLLHRGFAGESMEALRCLLRFGKKILYEYGRAVSARKLFERASQLSARHPEFSRLFPYIQSLDMESSYHEGQYERVLRSFEEGLRVAKKLEARGDMWRLYLCIGSLPAHMMLKRFADAARVEEDARSLLKRDELNVFSLLLLNVRARLCFERRAEDPGRLSAALDMYEESARAEERIDARNRSMVANNDLGVVLAACGRYGDAAEFLRLKIAKLKRARGAFTLINDTILLADALRMTGAYDDALEHGRRALELASKTGLGRWRLFAHEVLANIYHDMDRFVESVEEARSCLATSACIEDAKEHANHTLRLWLHMGHCYREMEDWDRAIAHFEAVLESGPPGFLEMLAEAWLGEVLFLKGEMEKARPRLDRAEALSAGFPAAFVAPYLFRVVATRAGILKAAGDGAGALALMPRLRALAGDSAKLLSECGELERSTRPSS